MKISVVIPTRNRDKYLDNTLNSLVNQTLDQECYEVIVIDNGSSDRTRAICRKYSKKIKNFKYRYDKRPGLHVGRNRGFLESRSDIILYADDDVIGSRTWLQGIIDGFVDDSVALVGGNVYPRFESEKPAWYNQFIVKDGEYTYVTQLSLIWSKSKKIKTINPYYVFGCNFGVRKKILEECGGFHPDGMPNNLLMYRGDGESYVSRYISEHNYRAVFNPIASVEHMIPKIRTTERYLSQSGLKNGISDMYCILRNKNLMDAALQYKKDLMTFRKEKNGSRKIYLRFVCRGEMYLLTYYILYKEIRKWVKKSNYL